MKVYNDGVHDSLINSTMTVFETIENIFVSVIIKVPADKNDKHYQKEFYRTTADMKKLLSGIEASFVAKVVMENFRKSVDFELKFPFQKVEVQQ